LIHFPQKVIAPRSLLPLRSRSISLIQFNGNRLRCVQTKQPASQCSGTDTAKPGRAPLLTFPPRAGLNEPPQKQKFKLETAFCLQLNRD
jgi:hypothetical protein